MTYTSNLRGAGTDTGVYVELIDTKGASSGRKQLVTSAADAFERGSVDEFRIKCQALGNLAKLRVGRDGKGSKPAWHLSKVWYSAAWSTKCSFHTSDQAHGVALCLLCMSMMSLVLEGGVCAASYTCCCGAGGGH